MVKVSFIDSNSGTFLEKSDPERDVSTYNEHTNVIIPIMTRPHLLSVQDSEAPVWEETLVFNEPYSTLSTSSPIVFFEILDICPHSKKNPQMDGWYRIAWAFLVLNPETVQLSPSSYSQARLQLYSFPSPTIRLSQTLDSSTPLAYACWKSKRLKYPSTLTVSISPTLPLLSRKVTSRPEWPTDIEIGTRSFAQLMDTFKTPGSLDSIPNSNSKPNTKPEMIRDTKWQRRRDGEGQKCELPNVLDFSIDSGWRGAFACAYSQSGRFLAVSGTLDTESNHHPVHVYHAKTGRLLDSLKGHQQRVYDIKWCVSSHGSRVDEDEEDDLDDDRYLITASADASVRVWVKMNNEETYHQTRILRHPCFVYSVSIRPTDPTIQEKSSSVVVATGSYDGVVRIFKFNPFQKDTQTPLTPVTQLTRHSCHVNSVLFDPSGVTLFSADGMGFINVWGLSKDPTRSSMTLLTPSSSDVAYEWSCTITLMQGCAIYSMAIHPNGRKILVHSASHVLKTLDIRIHRVITVFNGISNSLDLSNARSHELGPKMGGSTFIRSSFSPCGHFVVSGSEDGQVFVWRSESGAIAGIYNQYTIPGWPYKRPIVQIEFNPYDHMFCFVSGGGTKHPISIWTLDSSFPPIPVPQIEMSPEYIVSSPHLRNGSVSEQFRNTTQNHESDSHDDTNLNQYSKKEGGMKKSAFKMANIEAKSSNEHIHSKQRPISF